MCVPGIPSHRASILLTMTFRIHGTGTLAEILGDAVAYRLLEPVDPRIPGLASLRNRLGLEPGSLPRKTDPGYGMVAAEMLRAAAPLLTSSAEIVSVVMIGDTELSDGGAFAHTCTALGCPGGVFICSETTEDAGLVVRDLGEERSLILANRWRLISAFEDELIRGGVAIGPGTAVLIDIDKTLLGARGRNHQPIDAARGAAVLRTATVLRGDGLNRAVLMDAYDRFNQPCYHPFTTDNQDYLAYLAMIVESGWISPADLADAIDHCRFPTFSGLLDEVSRTPDRLPSGVRRAHERVVSAARIGDPTPFKEFRAAEFRETVDRMAPADGVGDMATILEQRLTLTAEVLKKARSWRDRGALLFGLSDKPDEASTPTPELEAEGYRPLHRTEALIVAESTRSPE